MASRIFQRRLKKKPAFVLMPGGGSPQTFFEILSHQEEMNWDDISIMATDVMPLFPGSFT